jgi:hypothetical protein
MKYNVGITIIIKNPKEDSLFSNGIRQNVILLREMYSKCKNVNNAYIINAHPNVTKESFKNTSWEPYADYIIPLEEIEEKCDLIVVCHGSLHLDEYAHFKSKGKKIVKQVLGAELNMFNEVMLFNLPTSGIYSRNPHLSAIWMSGHFYDRDRYFFEAMFDCPVLEGPYIWDPRFIQHHVEVLKKENSDYNGVYAPNGVQAKKIATMEPNLNMVKTCSVPIITAELLYRKYPESVGDMKVFGAAEVKKKKDLINFAIGLDIYKAKKMTFEARYPVVWSLYKHVDILLCHQNGCELNYLYLDAAWLGWPVVHNSPMMKDLGWYYPENNSVIAVEHINYIAKHFDSVEHPNEKYLKKSREFAYRYMINNPENISKYEVLIENAMTSVK